MASFKRKIFLVRFQKWAALVNPWIHPWIHIYKQPLIYTCRVFPSLSLCHLLSGITSVSHLRHCVLVCVCVHRCRSVPWVKAGCSSSSTPDQNASLSRTNGELAGPQQPLRPLAAPQHTWPSAEWAGAQGFLRWRPAPSDDPDLQRSTAHLPPNLWALLRIRQDMFGSHQIALLVSFVFLAKDQINCTTQIWHCWGERYTRYTYGDLSIRKSKFWATRENQRSHWSSVFQCLLSPAGPLPKTPQQWQNGSQDTQRNQSNSIVTIDKCVLKVACFVPFCLSLKNALHWNLILDERCKKNPSLQTSVEC